MASRIRPSSGNVFSDLGFKPAEAEHLRLRAELMIRAEKLIRASGWTQREAARILGVTQPRVSDLVRGKAERFSIDSLVEMLGCAGLEVRLTLRKRTRVA
jgi:predicted XRE-type DNA-binding protein